LRKTETDISPKRSRWWVFAY